MGMLMHHTWLEQQKEKSAPVKEPVKETAEAEMETEPEESVTKPVKRGRGRKPSK